MNNLNFLNDLVLAPYLIKATALIGVSRKGGGNQFRHQFATLGILIDYKYEDSVLLKASLLHDLVEDFKYENKLDEIRHLDNDGHSVVNLIVP